MEFLFFWLGLSVLCGVMAANRNRSGFGYFLLACIISPLLCFILLLIIGKAEDDAATETSETRVKCPDCRELVLHDARVCKHCGCKLIPQ